MKRLWLLGIFVASNVLADALPVVSRDGQNYVSSKHLEEKLGVAIKSLPAEKQTVACYRERCAVLEGVISGADGLLVRVDSVEKGLNARATVDQSSETVTFQFSRPDGVAADALPGVGRLAPDFRLTRLDGSSINFSDFRGKRVLINSWASW